MADSSKFSLSLGSKKPTHHHKPHHAHHNGTKRPHAALHDSDNEDDEGRHQEITHFDTIAGGAVNAAKKVVEKAPLVIPVGENRRKKQKSNLPSQNTEAAEAAVAEAKVKAAPILFGLNVREKATEENGDAGKDEPTGKNPSSDAAPTRKTVDEEALDALLGKKGTSNTVIPTLNEEEVFLRDYDKAPEAPTEADYDAVPIEEFGAAMLRGMGWKDGEAIGRNRGQAPVKPRVIERRAELLGVGAKPARALGIELGEWGKHAKKHERAINKAYAPVMLRNKKTGEMVTEEEFKVLTKGEEMGLVDDEENKSDKLSENRSSKLPRKDDRSDDYRKDRDRRRDRDRDYEDRKHKSFRRDRSSSADDRRRRNDDESDSERRERRREKDRKLRDRSVDDKDRHSSRRSDDKYREKDRDRKYREEDRSYRKERSSRSDRDHGRRER